MLLDIARPATQGSNSDKNNLSQLNMPHQITENEIGIDLERPVDPSQNDTQSMRQISQKAEPVLASVKDKTAS